MAESDEVDALFRRYRREAVLLHRPWPPHVGPPTNSHFGGLPNLPERYEWPRTSYGTPLHFMAQIDCADIRFKTALPERGVLFFFGQDNLYGAWHGQQPASDTCRVLYVPDAVARTPPRQPPADLPPIRYPARGQNVHSAWPIVPLKFDSFPGEDALPLASDRDPRTWRRLLKRLAPRAAKAPEVGAEVSAAYDARVAARRAAALVAATGAQPPRRPVYGREAAEGGAAIFDFAPAGPQSFPQHWANVHHLARDILNSRRFLAMSEEAKRERIARAERWLDRSREGPLDRPVAEDDRQALRTWLAGFEDCPQLVFWSAVRTIHGWAGDPVLAARILGHVYDACAPLFYGYDEESLQFAQMLGHSPSPHVSRPVDDPTICLLSLDTDGALGWYVGDGGQCTFWIDPGDLARRDFSRVQGVLDGYGH
jgi:hypothetical protein